VAFCPEGSRFDLCTAGDCDLRFWKVSGQNFKATQAFLGAKSGTWQPFLCLGSLDSDVVAGTLDGHLYRFRKHRLKAAVKAHKAPVLSMDCVPGKGLVSGAADGSIRLWNSDLECFAEFSTAKQVDSIAPGVRSLCWQPHRKRLLVGTAGAEIFELNDKTGADLNKGGAVMNGHYQGEVCGLAVHPKEQARVIPLCSFLGGWLICFA
jgi:WD40 repeat protein